MKGHIVAQEPNLKSFIRGSKSVVEVALTALLKLVSKETDGQTISLREEFDCALEDDGVHKSF